MHPLEPLESELLWAEVSQLVTQPGHLGDVVETVVASTRRCCSIYGRTLKGKLQKEVQFKYVYLYNLKSKFQCH